MERYLCIHSHFYQPPRENPWLETVEQQDSAYPYHDWNERITAESYAPNALSRILDDRGRIQQIVNNYSRISFNFGPTLLSWMEDYAPHVYQAILQADRESQQNFSGHGSAMAQAYNHMIMPLANRRDKFSQALWGVRDFEKRFGRFPEGMWLPETAVDTETLEILADLGIKFTVLAPHQAARLKLKGERNFDDVNGGGIDPTRGYLMRLSGGRSINLFFYDGPISRAVAFEKLLNSGEGFASRLLSGFSEHRQWPQLMHIATDGETYGHHHQHGDMALAYALHHIQEQKLARLTNYGEYLEKHPPEHEVQIAERTAWSCAHGVERWNSNCGCNAGTPGWNQEWRRPLRQGLDWLRDAAAQPYENSARELLRDPWKARDEYIQVVLDRSPGNLESFFSRHAARKLDPDQQVTALKLLELQRYAMLMYTSCGWFFDEISGIETVQIIMYAGRVIQLARQLFDRDLEAGFLERLRDARSNLPQNGNGAAIYDRWVRPNMLDLQQVGAHYAIASLFEEESRGVPVFCFTADQVEYVRRQSGRARLGVGQAVITSKITLEHAHLTFGVLHFGDHNIAAGVREFRGPEAYADTLGELTTAFARAELPEVVRLLDRHFGTSTYSVRSLFLDEQRRILNLLLDDTLAEAETAYRQVYQRNAPLMRFLGGLALPQPPILRVTAEQVLHADLRAAFQADIPNLEAISNILEQIAAEKVQLNGAGLGYAIRNAMIRHMMHFRDNFNDLEMLQRMDALVSITEALPFPVNTWSLQNIYWEMLQEVAPEMKHRNTEQSHAWLAHFASLGEKLYVAVPEELTAHTLSQAS